MDKGDFPCLVTPLTAVNAVSSHYSLSQWQAIKEQRNVRAAIKGLPVSTNHPICFLIRRKYAPVLNGGWSLVE